MTANQVQYWKLQEEKRHNVATESMDRPLKASQAVYYETQVPYIQSQTGLTKISTVVKGIEGFEKFASGLDHLASVASKTVGAAASAMGK